MILVRFACALLAAFGGFLVVVGLFAMDPATFFVGCVLGVVGCTGAKDPDCEDD